MMLKKEFCEGRMTSSEYITPSHFANLSEPNKLRGTLKIMESMEFNMINIVQI